MEEHNQFKRYLADTDWCRSGIVRCDTKLNDQEQALRSVAAVAAHFGEVIAPDVAAAVNTPAMRADPWHRYRHLW